ncbi:hypothetical protein GCM10010954_28880 [Halobacillus andaensis]|uniref:Uncharacterized protein n=1 Tax=Halobacillus andaensis TaxID=1176239 RepID=A0A917B973_HALAA|nr:hypothetical protein [Halobacillus andaensis]MBP2006519.1 hypothetical protein [Halobacillus andaensis]GGF28011.1 hypothetical protein GCM10010954_28880 [Halobacillus andaensis]
MDIKWTSLMLPEHVKMVQEIFKNKRSKAATRCAANAQAFALGMALKDLTVMLNYHNGVKYASVRVKVVDMNRCKLSAATIIRGKKK